MDKKFSSGTKPQTVGEEFVTDVAAFRQLLDEVRAGSQDAAWRLLELYGPHVYRVVRRHLGRSLRTRFDSADFVQSVWASFFTNCVQLRSFSQPADLIRFLAAIARNKVIDRVRRNQTSGRDFRREVSFERVAREDEARYDVSPSDFAIAHERWNSLVKGQPQRQQTIVQMKFMGEDDHAIAAHLRVSVRTVRRLLDKLLLEATA